MTVVAQNKSEKYDYEVEKISRDSVLITHQEVTKGLTVEEAVYENRGFEIHEQTERNAVLFKEVNGLKPDEK